MLCVKLSQVKHLHVSASSSAVVPSLSGGGQGAVPPVVGTAGFSHGEFGALTLSIWAQLAI